MAEPSPGLTLEQAAAKLMPEPEEQPEVAEQASDEPQSEPSEEVETTVEASEEVVEESTEEPVEDETVEFITDLNDWIRDKSHYGEIKIPTKVNGQEGEATLSDLIADYQIKQASEERLNSLKAEKAEFESERVKQQEVFNNQLTQATELVNLLEKQFLADVENINWEELRETDPAEYSARRQDLQEKQQQLLQAKESIQTEQQTKVMENYQTLLAKESQALMETFPSWADEAVAKQQKTEIRDFLLTSGFTPQEIDGAVDDRGNLQAMGIIDHRAINLAYKAMLYDRGMQKADVAKKKVMKVPKVAKPGAPKGKSDEDVEKQKKLRGKLKKSGKVEDAAALIRDRMFGG